MTKKYLKLTTTTKCLELAECLVGSGIRYAHGVDRLKYWDGWYLVTRDPVLDVASEDSFVHEILLPLDTLKLCPFMAMKYNLTLIAKLKKKYKSPFDEADSHRIELGSIGFKRVFMERFVAGQYEPFSLALDNLPEGASVVML